MRLIPADRASPAPPLRQMRLGWTHLAAVAAAAMGAVALATTSGPSPHRFIATEHPAAVLAWAQTRCADAPALAPHAPRVQTEDLLTVSAAFEQALARSPLPEVCAYALDVAAAVTRAQPEARIAEPALAGQPAKVAAR